MGPPYRPGYKLAPQQLLVTHYGAVVRRSEIQFTSRLAIAPTVQMHQFAVCHCPGHDRHGKRILDWRPSKRLQAALLLEAFALVALMLSPERTGNSRRTTRWLVRRALQAIGADARFPPLLNRSLALVDWLMRVRRDCSVVVAACPCSQDAPQRQRSCRASRRPPPTARRRPPHRARWQEPAVLVQATPGARDRDGGNHRIGLTPTMIPWSAARPLPRTRRCAAVALIDGRGRSSTWRNRPRDASGRLWCWDGKAVDESVTDRLLPVRPSIDCRRETQTPPAGGERRPHRDPRPECIAGARRSGPGRRHSRHRLRQRLRQPRQRRRSLQLRLPGRQLAAHRQPR